MRMAMLEPSNPSRFILVLLPESAGDVYTRVKRFGDIIAGIPTQCVVSVLLVFPTLADVVNLKLLRNGVGN
jgi:hypothetical protein